MVDFKSLKKKKIRCIFNRCVRYQGYIHLFFTRKKCASKMARIFRFLIHVISTLPIFFKCFYFGRSQANHLQVLPVVMRSYANGVLTPSLHLTHRFVSERTYFITSFSRLQETELHSIWSHLLSIVCALHRVFMCVCVCVRLRWPSIEREWRERLGNFEC